MTRVFAVACVVIASLAVAEILVAQEGAPEIGLPAALTVLARRSERLSVDGVEHRITTFVVRDDPAHVGTALSASCAGRFVAQGTLAACVGPRGTVGPVHVVRGDETGSVVHVVERIGRASTRIDSLPAVPATTHLARADGLSLRIASVESDDALATMRARWERDGWIDTGSAHGVTRFVREGERMDVALSVTGDALTVWTAR